MIEVNPRLANENRYLNLLHETLSMGHTKGDRTGTGTRSLFARQLRFGLQHGFPLLTTKAVNHKAVIAELCWMLRGQQNVWELEELGAKIWHPWADKRGNLGPVYGVQWRHWPVFERPFYHAAEESVAPDEPYTRTEHDQIVELERRLKDNPDDRRMIVSAWNVADLPDMRLPPCHLLFQAYTRAADPESPYEQDGCRRLSLQVYQRSADLFLGVPFNIASYGILTTLLAIRAGMVPEELIMSFGDVHVYRNHEEVVREQLSRSPADPPELRTNEHMIELEDLAEVTPDDVWFVDYDPHPALRAGVAV